MLQIQGQRLESLNMEMTVGATDFEYIMGRIVNSWSVIPSKEITAD